MGITDRNVVRPCAGVEQDTVETGVAGIGLAGDVDRDCVEDDDVVSIRRDDNELVHSPRAGIKMQRSDLKWVTEGNRIIVALTVDRHRAAE